MLLLLLCYGRLGGDITPLNTAPLLTFLFLDFARPSSVPGLRQADYTHYVVTHALTAWCVSEVTQTFNTLITHYYTAATGCHTVAQTSQYWSE